MDDHKFAVGQEVCIRGMVEQILIKSTGVTYFIRTSRNTLQVSEDEVRESTNDDEEES